MGSDAFSDTSLRAKFRRFIGGVAARRREAGLRGALELSIRWTAAFLHKQASAARDRVYDLRHGVDTLADQPGLEKPTNAAFDDAVYYARISPRIFARLMKDIAVQPAEFTFIDLGCGKGAALLLAMQHGFGSVIGVELNARLADIADQNTRARAGQLSGTDSGNSQVVRGDVVNFRFPESASVIYMYNPFGADTLKAVLDNIVNSLEQHPRELVIAYVSPWHAGLLDECPLLERRPSRSSRWQIYRTLPAAA